MDVPSTGPITTPGVHDELPWRIRLRQLFNVRWSEAGSLAEETISNWFNHNVPRLGASLTFYTLLSLAPLLIIVVAIAGAAFGKEAAEGRLVWQIRGLIGQEGAVTVQALLKGAYKQRTGIVATTLGILTLLYGASSVVAELRDALNTIWCVPRRNTTGLRSVLSILLDRTVALGVVLGIGFLLLVSLAVSAALSAVGDRFSASLPIPEWMMQSIDFAFTYVVIAILFAVIYKVLPDLHLEWRDVVLGAALTSLLFAVGKTAIGLYLGRAGIASTYGAAGSLVVLLVWVYYSAQIFFLGAEFTQVYAQRFGSRPCQRKEVDVKIVGSFDEVRGGVNEPDPGRRVTLS